MDEKKREETNEDRQVSSRAQVARRETLRERVSYAWGRWLSVPSNPDDEYVLA